MVGFKTVIVIILNKSEGDRYDKYSKSSSDRMWICRSIYGVQLVQKGLFSELVLIDANKEKAEGEAMDLSHGRPFVHSMKIYAGDYDDISDCALIIITAGANQKPGETRLDLVHKNVAIFKSIIPEITKRNFEGNLLIVANPVDILTYAALKISGYPKERVFGSGTVLDSARFRYLLSEHLDVDSRSVHAFIIGGAWRQ